MSWKLVSFFRLKSISLVNQMMIFYSLSTIGILLSVSLFLYPTFSKAVYQENQIPNNIASICYKKTIISILFGSLGAIILGHFIARKGLSRVKEFSKKIEKISADSLHERLNINDWPGELKTLGNNFNIMLDRVQSSFIQLTQFTSDIAHELRTPIHNLMSATELSLTTTKTIAEYRQLLESNLEEYQSFTVLIENLLFIARSDHGQISINKKQLNARTEIMDMMDYFQAIAEENHVKMTIEGESPIFVEPTLFKRVINNLLSNALRYTKRNGTVHIKIESLAKQFVKISVHDTGIGIANEHLPRLFDRFYRIDPSRSSLSGGVGLGLAIVKSIIDLHHGKISIVSKLNQGTIVQFELPDDSAV